MRNGKKDCNNKKTTRKVKTKVSDENHEYNCDINIQFSPRTNNQKILLQKIDEYDVVISVGPAGTGKTFVAVYKALELLSKKKINKIILTRPIVESWENLGFLPGDIRDKVDPYFRPIYDSLTKLIPRGTIQYMLNSGIIEIAPLAYMRGRTLENCFIILDEAQNTLPQQMKMFLTRMGKYSKIVITGDITQIDLYKDKSGLLDLIKKVRDDDYITVFNFDNEDIQRHPIVAKIIDSYNREENNVKNCII
jgi:phosphate starvation-inducible PhoH-like protein